MKKLFYTLSLLLGGGAAFAAPGDTTWVQAHNNVQITQYGELDVPVTFPAGAASYRKILMTFTLGTHNCPPGTQYCHQWDYDVHNVLMTPGGDTIELSRFITPFANTGVPRFPAGWKHNYVFDVTDYAPLLQGSGNTFRIFYSGYSFGFTADVKFAFIEGTPERNVLGVSELWRLSRAYGNAADPISNYLTPQTRTAPAGTQSATMKVLVTGHGSDANGCCEFDSHNYKAKVNGNVIANVPVWRSDCGLNDLYPQGGTWIYDRANWCPGAEVHPFMHPLTGVTGGSTYTAEMVFDPYTSSGNYGSYNIQANAIYYGSMNKAKDASLEAIYEPNNYEGYYRSNPSAGKPRIKVRNTGAAPITAMQIIYGVKDSAMSTYNWSGSLPSLAEDTLELPILPTLQNLSIGGMAGAYTFTARIASVNGSADNDAQNDTLAVPFTIAPKWPSVVVIEMKTNNEGANGLNQGASETSWELRNSAGLVVASRTNATLNTMHRDTVRFTETDLYSLQVTDGGCDGLHWWVFDQNPQIGVTAGSFNIRNAANGAALGLRGTPTSGTFSSDFGCGFREVFSAIGIPAGVSSVSGNAPELGCYPNPANSLLTIALQGAPLQGLVQIADLTGKVLVSEQISGKELLVNTKAWPSGLYLVKYTHQPTGEKKVMKVEVMH